MARIACVSLALALAATSAGATVVEIPLPGLIGTYPTVPLISTRFAEFHLTDQPAFVHSASFRVSGTTQVGILNCDGMMVDWPTLLYATMYDTPSFQWVAQDDMPYTAGAFSWTALFAPSPPQGPTWNFLLDGSGEISLTGGASSFVAACTPVSSPPTLTVTEAVLIIDAEFPIAVEASTWGKIKALYRD